MSDETLVLALIVAAATISQLIAARIGVPAIVPLLVAGVILGGSVTGILAPSELLGDLLEPLVNLAVAVILFEGALSLRRHDLITHGIGSIVGRLISLGVLVTWVLGTLGAWLIVGVDIRIALILGAVLTLSGPTVVLPLLDFVRPRERLGAILRWEGILIDPIGAILAVLTFSAISAGEGQFEPIDFVATIAVGAVAGVAGALALRPVLRSARFTHPLKSVATLGAVLTASAAASAIMDDAGLMSAVAMGVVLANGDDDVAEETAIFTETLVALLIGALFVILTAGVDLDHVINLGIEGLLFVAMLILLVRPLVAALCTLRTALTLPERGFIGWMMPRGIVAAATVSAFQLALEEHGVPDADLLTPLTFLVIAGTVIVYGLSARPMALALGVSADSPAPRSESP